jgi:hypothetical protein
MLRKAGVRGQAGKGRFPDGRGPPLHAWLRNAWLNEGVFGILYAYFWMGSMFDHERGAEAA